MSTLANSLTSSIALIITLLLFVPPQHCQAIDEAADDSTSALVFRAARSGNVSCLQKFLSLGFEVNTQNNRGYTPLMQAIASASMDTEHAVDFLLNNGADPLQPARDGTTPLQLADHLHRVEIAHAIFNAITCQQNQDFTPSLSMLIADLKFDVNGQVSILELGEGPLSYFKGHDALYPQGLIWQRFWQHLANKKLPMWYVGDITRAKRETEIISTPTFKELGGKFCKSLHELEANKAFKNIIDHARKNALPQAGFILLRHHTTNTAMRNYFKKTYPEMTLINDPARQFVSSKFMTNLLFTNDSYLQNFRPECHVYKKDYSPELVARVHADFIQQDLMVIKPLNAANGWGVIIASHETLDQELQTILQNKKFLKESDDPTYSYWHSDKNKHLIIEAFVQSKPICVNNKEYDATMRQVFVIESNTSGIDINFIGSYWKLPASTINGKGSLTELHKSNVKSGNKPSAIIAPEDDAAVQEALRDALPKIYAKMLQCLG